ncbi:MAG: ATP-binding cassette domain-containing protein, partial [Ureaplasma sp.]|nr:ATP-binding cassette domain-containing protein [Ureaplasma sp.]
MSSNKIISVNNLFSVYNENEDNQYVALSNINFDFDQNKIYFIIGNSGSGKSTLVTHFNGLINTKYGEINIYPDTKKINNETSNLIDCVFDNNLKQYFLKDTKFDDIICLNTNKLSLKSTKSLLQIVTRRKISKIQINKSLHNVVKNIATSDQISELDLRIQNNETIKSFEKNKENKLFKNKCFVNVQ